MLFNSLTYLFFLFVTVILRWVVPGRTLVPVLLIASYVFYVSSVPVYLVLLIGVTGASFLLGLAIERRPWPPKRLLLVGISLNLAILGYFKYASFFIEQVNLLRFSGGLNAQTLPSIILPLGISFLTFQVLAYLIDVYRGQPAERSLVRYSLFIAFFPFRAAGPITRGRELLPQFRETKSFDPGQFATGMDLIAIGFIKKICFADNLAKWSDPVFADPGNLGTWAVWVGVLAYTGQIYCDFSGYTDIARGSARLLGFELPKNFNLPYLSRSVTEFWRRWHMTLSFWLRDYLYIPLGGNRKGKSRWFLSLFVTMGLGGLWHGAGWTFVVWGLYHGLLLLLHKVLLAFWSGSRGLKRIPDLWPYKIISTFSTLGLVCIGWVMFRAPTFEAGIRVYQGMFRWRATDNLPVDLKLALALIGLLAAGHLLAGLRPVSSMAKRLPIPLRGVAWALSVLACYLMAETGAEFIYNGF